MILRGGSVVFWAAEFHELGVHHQAQNQGHKSEGGGGNEGESVEFVCEVDQLADDGAKGHNAQPDEHVESGVELGKVLLGKHPKG